MTLILLAAIGVGAGLAAILLAEDYRQLAFGIGIAGSVVALGIALVMPVDDSVVIGGVGLVTTTLVRSMAVAWAAGLAILGLLEIGVGGSRPVVVGPSLIGLAVASLALGTRDPSSSIAALAAGRCRLRRGAGPERLARGAGVGFAPLDDEPRHPGRPGLRAAGVGGDCLGRFAGRTARASPAPWPPTRMSGWSSGWPSSRWSARSQSGAG
jgi:hypothetical protein